MPADDEDFAADVLRKLLLRIDDQNLKGHGPYLVSHAWTEGPSIRLIYSAPPSDRTWGLARDTRESIIGPGPWPNADEAALHYFLVDFDENQPNSSTSTSDNPDAIWWFGYPQDGLPQRVSDVPESRLYTPPAPPNEAVGQHTRRQAEPRRSGNRPAES